MYRCDDLCMTTNKRAAATGQAAEHAGNVNYYARNLIAELHALVGCGPEAIESLSRGELVALTKSLCALLDEDGDATLIFNTIPVVNV